MQSVIGAVLAIGTLFLPESPRWLLDTEQDEEGMGVLADLHGDGDPEDERVRLERNENLAGSRSLLHYLLGWDGGRRIPF